MKPNRAGMVCFNAIGEVLVVTALGKENEWVFPKGHIEKEEAFFEAAERETAEEANIKCFAIGVIGTTEFDYQGEHIVTEWWRGSAIRVLDLLSSPKTDEKRQVKWLPYKEALIILRFNELKEILKKALCKV